MEECNALLECLSERGNASWLNPSLLIKCHSNLCSEQSYGRQITFTTQTQFSKILASSLPKLLKHLKMQHEYPGKDSKKTLL